MSRWEGNVAVVTGASAGIGAAVAEALVENGLKVVGIARRKGRVEELAKKLEGKKGKLYAVKADMSIKDEVLEAFEWITKNVGPISILVNNAGLGRKTTIVNGDIDEWKKVLDTNVFGLTIASREAVNSMLVNNIAGHIININSIEGHTVHPFRYQNVYAGSKHAVTAITETLRQELVKMGSKIKVTSLSPGHVDTDIFEANGFLECEETKKILSIAPSLNAKDIADAVSFILETPSHVQVSEMIIKPVGDIF